MDSNAREPLVPGTLLDQGRYEIRELVGQGSFSLTYAATQHPWGWPVALKEYFPLGCTRSPQGTIEAEGVEDFCQEGATLARFHNPAIVAMLGDFRANGTAYLVEELLDGFTLAQGLQLAGPMSLERVLDMAEQVGRALELIHASGLVHADLKPDNLYWTAEGRYVILDFGATRAARGSSSRGSRIVAVTPGYSPLEQYEAHHALTPAADVYALAATMHHLLSGEVPPESRLRTQGQGLVALPEMPEPVERAILDALHLHPLRRTQTIPNFLQALRGARVGVGRLEFTPCIERQAHPGGCYQLVLHESREVLYSTGRDGWLRRWSWPDLQPLGEVKAQLGPLNALALSADGAYLLSGAQDGSIKLWGEDLQGEGHPLMGPGPAVQALGFHPTLGFVAAARADGTCALLGPAFETPVVWMAHQGSVLRLDFSPDGTTLCTAGSDGLVLTWSLPDLTFVGKVQAHPRQLQTLRFCLDGRAWLTGASDLIVRLWDSASREVLRQFWGHRGAVWDAQLMDQNRHLATVSADGFLRLFRVESGVLQWETAAHQGWTRALACAQQQALLATGGADGKIRLWSTDQ